MARADGQAFIGDAIAKQDRRCLSNKASQQNYIAVLSWIQIFSGFGYGPSDTVGWFANDQIDCNSLLG